jgi:serine/threonine protein kinase
MINYELVEYLHRSTNGATVLKVKDKDRGNFYALKLIGPLNDNLKNLIFKREINALKILNKYDDIVKIYDADIHMKLKDKRNLGGILLELIEGNTIDQIDLSILSELKKQDLCLRILKAISNAHNNSVIHRDIKPDNIMYINGKVKVIDFGSSKIKSIIEKETTSPMYSPVYSAPEVVAGEETSEASDIYSLGAIFFKILLGIDPLSNSHMIYHIQNSSLNSDLKALLVDMLQVEPTNRFNDIKQAIAIFEDRIGILNVNAYKYCFNIDSSKLQDLKSSYIIEENTTMAQFISIFLPTEFKNLYGFYDSNKDMYKFIGNQLYMECYFDSESGLFKVTKISEISVDRKIRMQRIFCKVEGKNEFIYLKTMSIPQNNNRQLKTILLNHSFELKTIEKKSSLFEKLFGKWKQSLNESIDTIKHKNGRLEYTKFFINNNILTLILKEYKNNTIDNIDSNTKYIFEDNGAGRIWTYKIGSFEDSLFIENEIQLNIKLDPKAKLSKIKGFLIENKEILEDYNYKIMSYKRQIKAIAKLQIDECNARNLKDIILELEEPTITPNIRSLVYYSKELNDSQKCAVNKSLYFR